MAKLTKKNFCLSFVLTLILLYFSQHLYIDTQYWINKNNIPDIYNIGILYEGDSNNIKIVLPPHSLHRGVSVFYMGERIKDKNLKRIGITLYKYSDTYKFSVRIKNIKNIELFQSSFFNRKAKFDSIKINNQEILKDSRIFELKETKSVSIPDNINEFDVEIKCSQEPAPIVAHKFKFKNYILFFALSVFYFLIFLNLLSKFNCHNKNNNFEVIINFIKKYKIELLIFISAFTIYALFNLKTSLSINHFNRGIQDWISPYWIAGDEMFVVRKICSSDSKQFHPYFFLPLYPLFEFLMFISKNLYLSLSLMWYFFASLSSVFLYKSLNIIMPKFKKLKILLVLIFIFSLSQLLMSSIFDLYVIVGFYLSLLVYLLLKELQSKDYQTNNLLAIAIVASLIFGVNIVNLITALILISSVFIIKKNCKIIIAFLLILMSLTAIFISVKSVTDNGASYRSIFINESKASKYITTNIKSNIRYFYHQTINNPLIYNGKIYNPALLFWFLFVVMVIVSIFLYSTKKIPDKNKCIYGALLLSLLFNFTANFFWCPKMGFIFSQNYFVLIFVLFSFSVYNVETYLNAKNIKLSENFKTALITILTIFLIFEIIMNSSTTIRQNNNKIKFNPQDVAIEEFK